ncbi:MAG: DUF1887 family CARF protein [Bacteroidota bacterium]
MNNVLVNIVGDQPISCILFTVNTFTVKIDHYIFVTTELMERKHKTQCIIDALGLPEGVYSRIEIPHDDPYQIARILSDSGLLQRASHCLVNITSGTKVMAAAIYAFFTQLSFSSRSEVFYKPINDNQFHKIFPFQQENKNEISFRISLKMYLTSYGVSMLQLTNARSLVRTEAYTQQFYADFLSFEKAQHTHFIKQMGEIRRMYNNNRHRLSFIFMMDDAMQAAFQTIPYQPLQEGQLTLREMQYLIGGWLEEWAFAQIKRALELPEGAIACQVKIGRINALGEEVPNECDVLFMYNNTLYLVECKTGFGEVKRPFFEEAIYKLAVLRKEMGMRVEAVLLMLSSLSEKERKRQPYLNRASLHRIKLYDRAAIREEWPQWLQELRRD